MNICVTFLELMCPDMALNYCSLSGSEHNDASHIDDDMESFKNEHNIGGDDYSNVDDDADDFADCDDNEPNVEGEGQSAHGGATTNQDNHRESQTILSNSVPNLHENS